MSNLFETSHNVSCCRTIAEYGISLSYQCPDKYVLLVRWCSEDSLCGIEGSNPLNEVRGESLGVR